MSKFAIKVECEVRYQGRKKRKRRGIGVWHYGSFLFAPKPLTRGG